MKLSAKVASRYLASQLPSPLDGMPKRKVVKLVNQIIQKAGIRGIHRDQYWRPVQAIWKGLEKAGVPFSITKSEYQKENGIPVRKVWDFEIRFLNDRDRPTTIYGHVVAAGAGSIEDPLETYDVTAYAN